MVARLTSSAQRVETQQRAYLLLRPFEDSAAGVSWPKKKARLEVFGGTP